MVSAISVQLLSPSMSKAGTVDRAVGGTVVIRDLFVDDVDELRCSNSDGPLFPQARLHASLPKNQQPPARIRSTAKSGPRSVFFDTTAQNFSAFSKSSTAKAPVPLTTLNGSGIEREGARNRINLGCRSLKLEYHLIFQDMVGAKCVIRPSSPTWSSFVVY